MRLSPNSALLPSLLAATALVAPLSAKAQTAPSVQIGGFLLTSILWTQDDADKAGGPPRGVNQAGTAARSRTDFRNEVEIHLIVTAKAANGLAYGAVIELQNDNFGGGSGSGIDVDEAFVFVSSPRFGTLRFGEEDAAAGLLQVRAPSITGFGADGAWDNTILRTATGSEGSPVLMNAINDHNDATKIVYLSPQFAGFDFGLSYAPVAAEGDRPFTGRMVDTLGAGGAAISASVTQRDRTGLTNEISGALRYRGSVGGVGVAASVVGLTADAAANSVDADTGAVTTAVSNGRTRRDITVMSLGLSLSAWGFTLGGEYTRGDYASIVGRQPLANNADGTDRDASVHLLFGLTYRVGSTSLGAYLGQAEQDNGRTARGVAIADRRQTAWGLGIAYALAPGLEMFGSYNAVTDRNVNSTGGGGTLANRDIEGVFLGTRLAF
jgi:hypothetical protein